MISKVGGAERSSGGAFARHGRVAWLALLLVLPTLDCPGRDKTGSKDPPTKKPTTKSTYDPVAEQAQGCEGACRAGLCDETCPERRLRLAAKPVGLVHAPNLVTWLAPDGEVLSLTPRGIERRHLPVPATAVAVRADEVLAADKQGTVRVLRLRQEPLVGTLDGQASMMLATPNLLGWFPDRAAPPKTTTGPSRSLGIGLSYLLHLTKGSTSRTVQPDCVTRNVVASESRFAYTHDREVYVVDETQPAYRVYQATNYYPYLLSFSQHQFVMLGIQCGPEPPREPDAPRLTCLDRPDDDAVVSLTVLSEDGSTREVTQSKVRPWCATANDRVAVWCVGEQVEAIDLSTGRKKVLAQIPRSARPAAASTRPVSRVYSLASDGSLLFVGDSELRMRGLDWAPKS